MEAVVVDSTANSIVVEDLTGDLFEALGPEGRPIAGFVIFAFNDSKQANAPTYQTQGTWTSAPSYASSQTTFTDADADDNGGGFASWMIGSILVPDVNIGAPLIITGATATTLTVAGDARGVASNGVRYLVYAAPFTDPVRGTWQTDPHKGGTRYLWAGYRYQPPQMGFWVDPPGAPALGVYGAATGTNRLGQYYCWNRTYDVNLGRWTMPDPVATPWWNLASYCMDAPTILKDAVGLRACDSINPDLSKWLQGWGEEQTVGAETCKRLCGWHNMIANRAYSPAEAACLKAVKRAMLTNGCDCSYAPRKSHDRTTAPPPRQFGPYDYVRFRLLSEDTYGNPDESLGDGIFKSLACIPLCVGGCSGGKSNHGMPVDDKDCTKNTDAAIQHRMENFRQCIKLSGYKPVWPKPSACNDWWNDLVAGKSGMSGRLNAAECMKEMKAQPKRFAGEWFDKCKHYLCPQDLK